VLLLCCSACGCFESFSVMFCSGFYSRILLRYVCMLFVVCCRSHQTEKERVRLR